MTPYDNAKFYGYNSVEEYYEAQKHDSEIFLKGLEKKKTYVEKEPVKRGHWIITDDVEHFIAICSECGRTEDSRCIKDMPYCHCGADMRDQEMRDLTNEEAEIYNNMIEAKAVDLQPVIYCKNCIHARKQKGNTIYCIYFGSGPLAQDDFCSNAVQK